MTMSTYDQVLKMTKELNVPEQVQLLEELTRMVRQQVDKPQTHSIMELEGLGAEIWQDIDAQAYVNEETGFMGVLEELEGAVVGLDTTPQIYFIEKNPTFQPFVRPFLFTCWR